MLSEKLPAAAALQTKSAGGQWPRPGRLCWHSAASQPSTGARSGAPTRWSDSTSHREGRSAKLPIKRRTRVVGIIRKDAAIIRLVGALLLEQQEEWQLEGRRVFSELSMAKLDINNDPGEDNPYAALAAAA